MRAVLLVGSSDSIPIWQREALRDAIQAGLTVVGVLHCLNDADRDVRLKTMGYYVLAAIARFRNAMTGGSALSEVVPGDVPRVHFTSEWKGHWQRIPREILEEVPQAEVAIKLGMGLLRDPQELPFRHGVISYHHGEPEIYRGRPAAFHEVVAGEAVIGIIVQRLSNRVDGGEILARGYSRVVPYSYSQTLEELYATGVPLLARALRTLEQGRAESVGLLGANRTLPSNWSVARVGIGVAGARVRRLVYGALREKRWRIARLKASRSHVGVTLVDELRRLDSEASTVIPVPRGSTFVADPAGTLEGRIYCESLRSVSGRGVIAVYGSGGWADVSVPVGSAHLSYPQVVSHAGANYLFPEMAQAGPPTLFRLDATGLSVEEATVLRGMEDERLLDGTLFSAGDIWYLFGLRVGAPPSRLDLWTAPDLFGPWLAHPESPVCLDPRRARMAGPLVARDGHIYRFGQDGSIGYGRGVAVNRIKRLSEQEFEEEPIGEVSLSVVAGPHTILLHGDDVWFDFYTERWTPLAGFRRLKARFAR